MNVAPEDGFDRHQALTGDDGRARFGHHEVTVTLEDGTRYAGRFDVAKLEVTRDAIEVALEPLR